MRLQVVERHLVDLAQYTALIKESGKHGMDGNADKNLRNAVA